MSDEEKENDLSCSLKHLRQKITASKSPNTSAIDLAKDSRDDLEVSSTSSSNHFFFFVQHTLLEQATRHHKKNRFLEPEQKA